VTEGLEIRKGKRLSLRDAVEIWDVRVDREVGGCWVAGEESYFCWIASLTINFQTLASARSHTPWAQHSSGTFS
jgi:hypothetical protein